MQVARKRPSFQICFASPFFAAYKEGRGFFTQKATVPV